MIIGILATIAFLTLWNYTNQARDSKRFSDKSNIEKTLEIYKSKTWEYPDFDLDENWQKVFWTLAWDKVKNILPVLPLDPFTKKPYKIQLKNWIVDIILEWETIDTKWNKQNFMIISPSNDDSLPEINVTPVADPAHLTEAEKAKVKEEVEKATPTATNVVVADNGEVTVTLPEGTIVLKPEETVYQEDENLDDVKAKARKELNNVASANKNEINKRTDLTLEEKDKAKYDVNNALEDADRAIEGAVNSSEVDEAMNKGKQSISYINPSGDKKSNTKKEIDQAAKMRKDIIDKRDDLTKEEKDEIKSNVDNLADEAKKAIDSAVNNYQVDKAESNGKHTIDNIIINLYNKSTAKKNLNEAIRSKKELLNELNATTTRGKN